MGGNLSVAGLWAAVLGAATGGRRAVPAILGDAGARARLARICARLDGSRTLVLQLAAENRTPAVVARAATHRLTPGDQAQLERLRTGLDSIREPEWASTG
jgi:hypothetical protein